MSSVLQATWHPLVDLFVIGRYPKGEVQGDKSRRMLSRNDRGFIDFYDLNSQSSAPAFNLVDPTRTGLFPVRSNLLLYYTASLFLLVLIFYLLFSAQCIFTGR